MSTEQSKHSEIPKENLIYETESFTVERSPNPFVSREEGGHIRIFPKDRNISCINDLSPKQAIELIRLESVTREALVEGMNMQNVPVKWINLQDMGNWAFKRNERPVLHVHVFGRVFSENGKQSLPEAVYLPDKSSGYYEGFSPLTNDDMKIIGDLIQTKLNEPRYDDSEWRL